MNIFDGNSGPCRSEWGHSDPVECEAFMRAFRSFPGTPQSVFQCFPERALLRDACAQVSVESCTSDADVIATCRGTQSDRPPAMSCANNTLTAPIQCEGDAVINPCPNGLSYAICEAADQDGTKKEQYFTVLPGESEGTCEWGGPRDLPGDDRGMVTCDTIYRTETPLSFPCGGGNSDSAGSDALTPDLLAHTGYGLVGAGFALSLLSLKKTNKWMADSRRMVVRPTVQSIRAVARAPGRLTENMYDWAVAGDWYVRNSVDPVLNWAPDLDRYGTRTGETITSMVRGTAAISMGLTTRLLTFGIVDADRVPVIRDVALAHRTYNRQRQIRTFLDNVERTQFNSNYTGLDGAGDDRTVPHRTLEKYSDVLQNYTTDDEKVALMKLIRDYNLSPQYPYTKQIADQISVQIEANCPNNCNLDPQTFETLKTTLRSQLSTTAPDRWNNIAAYAAVDERGMSEGIKQLCSSATCDELNAAVKSAIETHLLGPIFRAEDGDGHKLRHETLKALIPGYEGALLAGNELVQRGNPSKWDSFPLVGSVRFPSLRYVHTILTELERNGYEEATNRTGLDGFDWTNRRQKLNEARQHAYTRAAESVITEANLTRKDQMVRRMRLMDQKLNHLNTAVLSPLTVRRWTLRSLNPNLGFSIPTLGRDLVDNVVSIHPLNEAGVRQWGREWYDSSLVTDQQLPPSAPEPDDARRAFGGSE